MTTKLTTPGLNGYPFPIPERRARCIAVTDGDTVSLFVDKGENLYSLARYRLLGVNTPELKSADPEVRLAAQRARDRVIEWLRPAPFMFPVERWDVIVRTKRDPDSFGRWLADLWSLQPDSSEVYVCQLLLDEGLAVPFKR